jgi:hypothetical protein
MYVFGVLSVVMDMDVSGHKDGSEDGEYNERVGVCMFQGQMRFKVIDWMERPWECGRYKRLRTDIRMGKMRMRVRHRGSRKVRIQSENKKNITRAKLFQVFDNQRSKDRSGRVRRSLQNS